MDLKNVKKVVLNDYSEYKDGQCNNGGCYGFYTTYLRDNVESETWKVLYGTTADMDYCPVCGSFTDHWDEETDGYSCGDFETVTTKELSEIIKSFEEEHENDYDYFVEVSYGN